MRPFANIRTLVRLLRHRDYRRYLGANLVSLTGTWMHRVTVAWLTWEMTQSGTWLGLMAFADLFPTLVFGIVAGAAADRWPLMPLLRVTQFLGFVTAMILAGLLMVGLVDVIVLFGITVAFGVIASFAQPARMTVVAALVPRAELGAAIAANSLALNLARFIGPACAGVLIAGAGVGWAFVANALSYLVFVWALLGIDLVLTRRETAKTSMLTDIVEGFVYAVGRPGIWAILVTTICVGFGSRPVIELFAGFASGVFGSDATGLAALTSAVGVGAILGGTWMVGRATAPNLTRSYLTTAAAAGLTAMAFTASPNLPVAVLFAGLLGFFSISTGIAAQTLMQLAAAEGVRGRMLSLFGLLQRGVPAIGSLSVGFLSEFLGLRLAAASTGVILVGTALVLLAFSARIAPHLDEGGKGS